MTIIKSTSQVKPSIADNSVYGVSMKKLVRPIFVLFIFSMNSLSAQERFDSGRIYLKGNQPIPSPKLQAFVAEGKQSLPTEVKDEIKFKLRKSPCDREEQQEIVPSSKVAPFKALMSYASCGSAEYIEQSKPNERFSNENCKMLLECASNKLKGDNLDLKGFLEGPIGEEIGRREPYVHASTLISQNINSMDKIEILRKFAEKKYGKDFASSCKSPFNFDPKAVSSCDKTTMDAAFAVDQGNPDCKGKMDKARLNCFNSGVNPKRDYDLHDFSKVPDNESSMQSFFKERANQIANDPDTDNFAQMLAAAAVSGRGEEEKKLNVLNLLNSYTEKGFSHPIFGFENKKFKDLKELEKSVHYQFFSMMISSHLSGREAQETVANYQKDFARKTLANSCPKVTYMDMCEEVSQVAAYTDALDEKSAVSLYHSPDKYTVDWLKDQLPNTIENQSDAQILMDAYRCDLNSLDTYDELLKPNANNLNGTSNRRHIVSLSVAPLDKDLAQAINNSNTSSTSSAITGTKASSTSTDAGKSFSAQTAKTADDKPTADKPTESISSSFGEFKPSTGSYANAPQAQNNNFLNPNAYNGYAAIPTTNSNNLSSTAKSQSDVSKNSA